MHSLYYALFPFELECIVYNSTQLLINDDLTLRVLLSIGYKHIESPGFSYIELLIILLGLFQLGFLAL